ncbi:MAG: fructosamine kinase family protein [Gammaproteobacteria bacterium]|nr:fructosamine kinase family protein [Gammaproteobacteria bacterium]MDH5501357.1 fructosamine kinase family protein [Gammaproteobacteria bacterium]
MPRWDQIFDAIHRHGIAVADDCRVHRVGGGDHSSAWQLRSAGKQWFVKTGSSASLSQFEAESDGLRELRAAGAVRVPDPIACGSVGNDSYLVLEWLALEQRNAGSDAKLGEGLALQHRCCADRFGWHRDNTIGATPQRNTWNADWQDFFRRERIGYQLALAAQNGFGGELQEQGDIAMAGIGRMFAKYRPLPSLLHGDLWGGNYASVNSEPVIFDPAVYFGDRETDLAMTRLFGGFGEAFYRAYETSWPLDAGHEERSVLYQLYHVLNHLNIFGAGYLSRSLQLLRRLNRAG